MIICNKIDFTFERINQASTVAGPFVFWLESQLDYAKLLEKVSPIQNEVERLQNELKANQLRAKKLEQMLVELNKKVRQCRQDMMQMVRRIVKLQDDIKEARNLHAADSSSSLGKIDTSTIKHVKINVNISNLTPV